MIHHYLSDQSGMYKNFKMEGKCQQRSNNTLKGKADIWLGSWGDILGKGNLGLADSGVSAVVLSWLSHDGE